MKTGDRFAGHSLTLREVWIATKHPVNHTGRMANLLHFRIQNLIHIVVTVHALGHSDSVQSCGEIGRHQPAQFGFVGAHSRHLFGKLAFELKLDRFEPPSRDAAPHPPVTYSGLTCAELLSQGTDTADQLNGFFEGLYFIHALIITFVLALVNTFGLLG